MDARIQFLPGCCLSCTLLLQLTEKQCDVGDSEGAMVNFLNWFVAH